MPAKNSGTESGGFTAEERAAMKERAAELPLGESVIAGVPCPERKR